LQTSRVTMQGLCVVTMQGLCVVTILAIIGLTEITQGSAVREKRELSAECEEDLKKFETCYMKSVEDFSKATESGDDDRPDMLERKTCNWMTAIVDDCQKVLVPKCFSQSYSDGVLEKYIKRILKVAKIEAKSWDNDKCPAVKKFMERVQADETCEDDLVKFESCYKKTVDDYSTATEGGDDGKPGLEERKTCDMMTNIIKVCQKLLLQNCGSQKYANQVMDKYLKKILAVVHTEVDKWDSNKCSAVRDFEERVKKEGTSESVSTLASLPMLLLTYFASFI